MYLMVLNKLYNLLGDSASLAGQTLNKFSVAISIEVEIRAVINNMTSYLFPYIYNFYFITITLTFYEHLEPIAFIKPKYRYT